jgi:hypothetical protein
MLALSFVKSAVVFIVTSNNYNIRASPFDAENSEKVPNIPVSIEFCFTIRAADGYKVQAWLMVG